jgi:hypothetical protein
MEGALLANPHWARSIGVRRMPYPRPRNDVIALIGEENQSLPVLVLADNSIPPEGAKHAEDGRAFLDEPKTITRYLAATYGGAGPHP